MNSNQPGERNPFEQVPQNPPRPNRERMKTGSENLKRPKGKSVLFPLILFVVILAGMYFIFPKKAGFHASSTPYDGLVISEVMAANSSAVPDENGCFHDWLELYNGSGHDLDMKNIMLTNRTDRICFVFPEYSLKAGERVIIFASDSYQLDPSKPFHGKFKISSAGSTIYLYDPELYLIDQLSTPTLTSNSVYALTGIDEDGERHYETSSYYSPGYENSREGFNRYRLDNQTDAGILVINEVCPDPKIGIPDEDGEICDWIEIYNSSDKSINLSNYYLSDKENKPMKWRFPDGTVIGPKEYYLVFCSGKDKIQTNGIPHTNFSISAEFETIVLSDAGGRLVDRVSVENVAVDHSYGRTETGEWREFTFSSPKAPNNSAGQAAADQLFLSFQCNPTGVHISEVMSSNDSYPVSNTHAATDWCELYNSSSQAVNLSQYGLSDSITRPRKWQFPEGTVIYPGQYLLIALDGKSDISIPSDLHANFKLSRSGGEVICFCDPTGRVLDRIPLSTIPTDHSYGRTLAQTGFFYYDTPTPGEKNSVGYYGYAQAPTFSLPGGEYKGTIELSISVPENCTVYYTLDGSIPDKNTGIRYDGTTLSINSVTLLRACSVDPTGMYENSEIVTQTYLMNLYHTLPIVSLTADPDELWNPENGMLTVGENVDKSKGIPFKNTIYREFGKICRPGHIEYYSKEGETILNQDCEFGLQGQYSLDMPQKSFKVKAKAKYGSKYFNAKLFDQYDFTQYKSFVLRMSGNDCVWTRINDAFQSTLIDRFNEVAETPTDVIHQAWKPIVVYLNGRYWGHYNLRERVDRYFIAQHEGLSLDEADNMDILEASSKVFYGSAKEYKDMIKHVKNSSPGTNEGDLQYILNRVDVDNYFDYMALEMFFGNSDPGNIRYYKLKREGSKWKWVFYDADYGLFRSGFDSPTSYLKEKGAGQQNIDNTLIRKLLENSEMKDKFLTRLGEIYQVFTTEFMITVFNECASMIEAEMPLHFARWAEENDKNINVDSPTTPEGALRYWNTRLDYTRNVLKKRPTYFYEMVQEKFKLTNDQMLHYFGEKPALPDDAVYTEGKKWG